MKNNIPFSRKLLAAGVVLFALLFFYCKNDSKTGPVVDNTVNVRMDAAVSTLNIYLTSSGYARYVGMKIFQSLGELDPVSLELKPVLVKSLPAVRKVTDGPYAGSLAYDFEILDEAKWDNGTPVTGKDIEFTLKIIFHTGLPTETYRGYFEYLKGIETDPSNPKKFTAYYRQYYMLMLDGICGVPILPAYNYDAGNLLTNIPLTDFLDKNKAKQLEANPSFQAFAKAFQEPKFANDKNFISGSGPYQLESNNGEQGTVLVKKQNWWGDAITAQYPILAAYPERLSYKIVSDEAAIENLLKTDALDVAVQIAPVKFLEMKQNPALSAKYDFHTFGATQFSRIALNTRIPKLEDKRVRQAIAHAVDYDYLLNTVMQGLAQRLVGPINPAKSFYAKNVPLHDFNIEKSKKLLAEAGWTDSDGNGIVDKIIKGKRTELSINLMAPTKAKTNELAALNIQETAQRAGIKINIIPADIEVLTRDTKQGQFEAAMYGSALHPGLVELYQTYHSASLVPKGDNRTGFSKADSAIVAIRTTEDETTRNALYVKAQEIIHEEVPEVYLYAPLQRIVVAKRFDYVITPNRPGYYEQMFKLKAQQ
jgi:peptide/nickel transport system substrate-binding protein